MLYNKLKDEWFEEFGIIGKEESYFYNKNEYGQLQMIRYLPYRMWYYMKKTVSFLKNRH